MLKYKHGIKLPSGIYIAFSKVEAKIVFTSSELHSLDDIVEQLISLNICDDKDEVEKDFVFFNVNKPVRASMTSFVGEFQPYLNDKILFLHYLKIFNEVSRHKREIVDFVKSGKLIVTNLHKNMNVKFYCLPKEKGFSIPKRYIHVKKISGKIVKSKQVGKVTK